VLANSLINMKEVN